MRKRPFRNKRTPGLYRWNGLIIQRQDNKLWGIWINHKNKYSSDHKTLKECMDAIDLYWRRRSRQHLQLVPNPMNV